MTYPGVPFFFLSFSFRLIYIPHFGSAYTYLHLKSGMSFFYLYFCCGRLYVQSRYRSRSARLARKGDI